MIENKDVFGNALWDYHQSPGNQELIINLKEDNFILEVTIYILHKT